MSEHRQASGDLRSLVGDYLAGLGVPVRSLAEGEWGVTLPAGVCGERALDIGLRVSDGLLAARAFVADASHGLDPSALLHLNRHLTLVRVGASRSGELWIHGELLVDQVSVSALDRLLGHLVETAALVREAAWPTGDARSWDSPWTRLAERRESRGF